MTVIMERPSATDERDGSEPELLRVLNSLDLPPGYRAEVIEGNIVASPAPQADHQQILMRISRPLILADWDPHWDIGVAVSADGYFIPDLTVVPRDFQFGAPKGSTQSSAGIEMVAEVTSSNADKDSSAGIEMVAEVTSSNADKDRGAKRRGYAGVGVPLYLLIDRERKESVLFSEPENGDYTAEERRPLGEPIPLPEPFSFALEDIR